jgi:hypothetical protein
MLKFCRLNLLTSTLAAVFSVSAVNASESKASSEADPLFSTDSVLNITIDAPLRDMARDRSDEPEYRPGTLRFVDADGVTQQVEIKVRPRGKSRRDRTVCSFPPLRLNFKAKQLEGTVFENQNILKLVTHCKSSEKFQNYVLKEYLSYRMFNLLSDTSFRVRLLKVTYTDSERDAKPYERFGFVIEHKKRLAARLGAEAVEPVSIESSELEPHQASVAELFQYLISNTDYSFIAAPPGDTCCHNSILLQGPQGSFLPVPYDFDRTGLVSPPNALPDENLGQRTVRERLYRGFCRPPEYLNEAIAQTIAMRTQFEALFSEQIGLADGERRKALKYLDSYYKTVEDPSRRERALKCRGLM